MLRDRAIRTSLETRVPLIQNVFWADFLSWHLFSISAGDGTGSRRLLILKTFPVSASAYAGGSRLHGRLLSGLSSNCIGDIA